jgi:hypothetical protein
MSRSVQIHTMMRPMIPYLYSLFLLTVVGFEYELPVFVVECA